MSTWREDSELLVAQLQIELPGSSAGGIKLVLFETLHEFCWETNAWFQDISIVTQVNVREYDLAPDNAGAIVRLISFRNDPDAATPPPVIGGRDPIPAAMPHPGHLVLRHVPTISQSAIARVTLVPSSALDRDGYAEVPDWFLPLYREVILDGTLGKMMAQKAKPYTDPTLAMFRLRRFRNGLTTARVATARQNIWGAQSWRYPSRITMQTQRGYLVGGFAGPY